VIGFQSGGRLITDRRPVRPDAIRLHVSATREKRRGEQREIPYRVYPSRGKGRERETEREREREREGERKRDDRPTAAGGGLLVVVPQEEESRDARVWGGGRATAASAAGDDGGMRRRGRGPARMILNTIIII